MAKNNFSIKELYTQYRKRFEDLDQLRELGESQESVRQRKQELAKSFLKRIDAEYEGKKLKKSDHKIADIAAIAKQPGGYDTTNFCSAIEVINLLNEGEKNVITDFKVTKPIADEYEPAKAPPKRYERGDYKEMFAERRAARPSPPRTGGLLSAARDFANEAEALNDRKQQPGVFSSAVRDLENDARGVAKEATKTVKDADRKASDYLQVKSDRVTVKVYEEAKTRGKSDFTKDQIEEYQKAKANVVKADATATCKTYKSMIQDYFSGGKEPEKEEKKENTSSWNPLKW
jgi:hypothetical protein